MNSPPTEEEDIEVLLARAYPGLSEAERAEVLLDLQLLCRWVLEQVELDTPALRDIAEPVHTTTES